MMFEARTTPSIAPKKSTDSGRCFSGGFVWPKRVAEGFIRMPSGASWGLAHRGADLIKSADRKPTPRECTTLVPVDDCQLRPEVRRVIREFPVSSASARVVLGQATKPSGGNKPASMLSRSLTNLWRETDPSGRLRTSQLQKCDPGRSIKDERPKFSKI
jgi:hypothetical protein